MVLTNSELKCW